jgi:uncharacterized protein with FMN-binding domain
MIRKVGFFVFCLTLTVATAATLALKDGTYAGQSGGYKGPVRVAVTVKGGQIFKVEVTACQDTFARKVTKEIPRRIVSANSIEVDVVSGATISSRAIKRAVGDALKKAQ